jgi:hypothetical protein
VDGVFVEDAYLFLECALDRIADDFGDNSLCFTVLSASDPYAVTGAFGNLPDVVTGLATSTRAGIELVEKLSGIQALNVLDRDAFPQLRNMLLTALNPENRGRRPVTAALAPRQHPLYITYYVTVLDRAEKGFSAATVWR